MLVPSTLAELRLDSVGIVTLLEPSSGTLLVRGGDRLQLVDIGLHEIHGWALPSDALGSHDALPTSLRAIISRRERVMMLDAAGVVLWETAHPAWDAPGSSRQSGCAWFSGTGAFAVVPADGPDGCDLWRLDIVTGEVLAQKRLDTDPAGIQIIHGYDGWIGLSVGEGQDAALMWFVRPSGETGMEVRTPGWTDRILIDIDPTRGRFLTTPHSGAGDVIVHDLETYEEVARHAPDEGSFWLEMACFISAGIIATYVDQPGDEHIVLIAPDGSREEIQWLGYPTSAGASAWCEYTTNGITTRSLTR